MRNIRISKIDTQQKYNVLSREKLIVLCTPDGLHGVVVGVGVPGLGPHAVTELAREEDGGGGLQLGLHRATPLASHGRARRHRPQSRAVDQVVRGVLR